MPNRSTNCSVWAITASRSPWTLRLVAAAPTVDGARRAARRASRGRRPARPPRARPAGRARKRRRTGRARRAAGRRAPLVRRTGVIVMESLPTRHQGLQEQPLPRIPSQGSWCQRARRAKAGSTLSPQAPAPVQVETPSYQATVGAPARGRSARHGRWTAMGGSAQCAPMFIGLLSPSWGGRRSVRLVARVADLGVWCEDHPEVGVVQPGVRRPRDDGEAALDDVRVDHQQLLDPARCLTTTSPVVTSSLISSARSTLLSSRKRRSSLAVAEPLSITLRRSLSEPARVPVNSSSSLGEGPDRAGRGDLARAPCCRRGSGPWSCRSSRWPRR